MIHIRKVEQSYFNYLKYGIKEYELSLYDDKIRNIQKGDFIEFQKEPLLNEKIIVMVDSVIYYDNFCDLLNNIDSKLIVDSSISKEKLISDLENKYQVDKQKEYGVLAIKLRKNIIINCSTINNISSFNKIFNSIRNNYNNFDIWLNKMKDNNTVIYYTKLYDDITSLLILKINEDDSQQFLEKGNILKIRTFFVNDNKKGIGKVYLNFVYDIAINNDIDYIYLTIKSNNIELINYFKRNGYSKYKIYNDEVVYYKKVKMKYLSGMGL